MPGIYTLAFIFLLTFIRTFAGPYSPTIVKPFKSFQMKSTLYLLGVFTLLFISCNEPKEKLIADIGEEPEISVEQGKYLVITHGCADCHSPKKMTEKGPQPDMARFMSGYPSDKPLPPLNGPMPEGYVLMTMDLTATRGPWGTSFAANLTPHETGIGSWTEEQFVRAVKQGQWRGMEGTRKLFPPMPWPAYANMTDADVKSMFAYLKTLEPVDNVVPNHRPPGK